MTSHPSPRELLIDDIQNAGFYPELMLDTMEEALAGLEPTSHIVQVETHFDHTEVHRHITVLVLAGEFLLVAHLDDQALDDQGRQVVAHVSLEALHLSAVSTVTTSFSYLQPQNYRPGSPVSEVSILIAWTGSHRLDLQPADCPDPSCEAEHGYSGVAPREDIVLRVSARADGAQLTERARIFARDLRAARLVAQGRKAVRGQ